MDGVAETAHYAKEMQAQRAEAARILQENAEFRWENPNTPWVGMDQNGVRTLLGEVSQLVGIEPKHAQKISVYFGDAIKAGEVSDTVPSRADHVGPGYYVTEFDDNDNVSMNRVVINRSKAVATESLEDSEDSEEEQRKTLKEMDLLNESGEKKEIMCEFEDPKEYLIWVMAEELKHVQINLKGGSLQKSKERDQRYLQILEHREIKVDELYDIDLDEVTVSRAAVRALAKYYEQSAPERSRYFTDLYKKSLEMNIHISPNVTNVIDTAYV